VSAAPDWASLPAAGLAEHLGAQRWSGARGAAIADVRVEAAVPFPLPGDDAPPCAVVVVAGKAAGAPVRWQLPLAADAGDGAAVATPGGRVVRDATALPAFRDALRAALAEGRRLEGRAADGAPVAWSARRVGGGGRLDAPLPSRVGSAEQSNTSLLYGDAAIVKLFRRLEAGPQPDVEIGAALAGARFAHVPALLGVVELEREGARTVLGMAQAMVPGAVDAWAWLVARAAPAVREGEGATAWDESVDEARRLGAVTRALHDALATVGDVDFAPQRAGGADVARWAGDAAAAFADALAAVEPAAVEPAPGAADGPGFAEARSALGALAARGDELRARLDALAAEVGDDAGACIRHHGDYHLGQVLRAADGGLAVIDFEGEPARPLATRRARHSALRDVAGMLRSFGYAAATALRDGGGPAASAAANADAWERAARAAFLQGYRDEPRGGAAPPYLPARPAAFDALARIFELEKLFYELRYEVRNRPDWLPIPLRGLLALLADSEREAAAAPPGGR
jgi:trehalose synthase-fused probable maltokinase